MKSMRSCAELVAASILLAAGVAAEVRGAAAPAGNAPRIATIKEVRRAVLTDAVRVTIELDGEVAFRDDHLENPARVFLDLSSTRAGPALVDRTLRFEGDSDVVRQVRIGRHPNNTTRVVLDAIGVSSYSVYALYNPYRLVIDCARPAASASVPPALRRETTTLPLLSARRLTTDWGRRLPSIAPRATE